MARKHLKKGEKNEKNKKGFTIVELVIVIAVIGVLAGIIIPVFINLNAKANKAADDSLVKNLNTALATQEQMPGDKKNVNFHEAIIDLDDYGYKLTNLITKSEESLLWNSKTNRFLLTGDIDKETNRANKYEFWKIADSFDNSGYSIYAGNNFDTSAPVNITNGAGFDAGYRDSFSTINYTREYGEQDGTAKHDVVIRTNSGTLTVNASKDEVRHYGNANIITLSSVASESYYEYGTVNLIDIKNGRLVITNANNASVGTIYLTATNNTYDGITLATQNGSELPEVIAREQVDNPTTGQKLVVTIQTNVDSEGKNPTKTEKIYLYPESDVKEETSGYNVSDLGLLVVEAISSSAQEQAETQLAGKGEEVIAKVKEEKTENKEDISTGATYFAGGAGNEKSPYLISNAEELSNIREALDANFELTNDIDMSGVTSWTPIGTSTEPFSGKLDGCDYSITNWTTSKELFVYVIGQENTKITGQKSDVLDSNNELVLENVSEDNYTAVIKNLNFKNCEITIDDGDFGIIADIVKKAYIADCEFSHCNIKFNGQYRTGIMLGRVVGSHIKKLHLASDNTITNVNMPSGYFGNLGLIIGAANYDSGTAYQTIINGCVNDASATLNTGSNNYGYLGGIIGFYSSTTRGLVVIDCVNNGNLTINNQKTCLSVSGICGADAGGGNGYFINCHNNGNIIVTGNNLPFVKNGNKDTAYGQLSGICSYTNSSFIDCTNNGSLIGNAQYVGGMCGRCSSNTNLGELINCSNTGLLQSMFEGAEVGDLFGGNFPDNVKADVDASAINSLEIQPYRIHLLNAGSVSGTMVVPASVKQIIVDGSSFGFTSIDLSNISGTFELQVSNANISLIGDNENASVSVIGENNTVTVGSGIVLNNVKIDGADSRITNEGTINHLSIVNTNSTSTNNGVMGSVQFIGSDNLEMAFVNNGSIGQIGDNWHTVQTQSQVDLTFTNNGTIYGNGQKYALLFYGNSNVTFNAGADSKLVIENPLYTAVFFNVESMRADTVTFNVPSGAAGVDGSSYYGISNHIHGDTTQVTVNIL